MSILKKILLFAAPIVLLFLFVIACLLYRTDYAKTEILTSASTDGQYSLTVYQIGEPDWPFGPTHCRFDLKNDSKRIVKYPFSIRNDGVSVSMNNFTAVWNSDSVTVRVIGEEQPEDTYILYFDGTIE